MEKKKILENLLEEMNIDSGRTAGAAHEYKQAAIDAPGRNQSRYDSSKTEHGDFAGRLSNRYTEKIKGIESINKMKFPKNPDSIRLGTLVSLENGNGNVNYFVLPYGGGKCVDSDKGKVAVVTPESPVFQAMNGKVKGEEFSFREMHYKVLGIL